MESTITSPVCQSISVGTTAPSQPLAAADMLPL
jgi:hypothetical protein